jgi:Ras family
MNELRQNVPQENNLVIAMCATKCDLALNPDTSQAEALAAATGSMFMTTSAKTNTNVNSLFHRVSERVLQIKFGGAAATTAASTPPISLEDGHAATSTYGSVFPPSTSNGTPALSNTVGSGSRILTPPTAASSAVLDPSSSLTSSNINSQESKTPTKYRNGTRPLSSSSSSKKNEQNGTDPLNELIEEEERCEGFVEPLESGESNDSHYSRCGGLMSCDVSGSSTDAGSGCVIQ